MMRSKKTAMIIATLALGLFCEMTVLAQGGWDVWTIYLRDGTRIDAAPVWSLDKDVLKYGMSGEVGEGKQPCDGNPGSMLEPHVELRGSCPLRLLVR